MLSMISPKPGVYQSVLLEKFDWIQIERHRVEKPDNTEDKRIRRKNKQKKTINNSN